MLLLIIEAVFLMIIINLVLQKPILQLELTIKNFVLGKYKDDEIIHV
jgi:hypothetical protein